VSAADDEDREYLQSRITVLYKLMFWSLVALLAYIASQYAIYGGPKHRHIVYLGSSVLLAAMAFVWRVLLVRRPLSIRSLHALDFVYSFGVGSAFGASAFLQYDLRPAGYMSLIYSACTVFARALIVPSSAARTAVASTLTFVPMTISAFALAVTTTQELPPPAYITGYLLLSTVPVVLATVGSYIIYDLNRQISAAEQLGQYTLVRRIGEGGMGVVYEAHHVLLRRSTAVKRMHPRRGVGPDEIARFEREVRLMSTLSHPNTVAVYDYGCTSDGVFYYAMEYLGGGIDLDRLVARHGKQPIDRVVRILVQVCGALQEAHDRNMVHRDIKPPNIILCERGGMPDVAKVVDFGLVKEIEAEPELSRQIVVGTPAYLSPEAVTDEPVGPAADLYSLGCVAYFLITGRQVFESRVAIELCIAHSTKQPTPPSQLVPAIPAALEAIILRCLAKQPADRFASAAALADALRAVPATGDWDLGRATRWWADVRANKEAAAAASSMETITVDLEARESAA